MSTLAEIVDAVERLSAPQKEELFAHFASQSRKRPAKRVKLRHYLKSADYPPIDGLPSDLSVDTKEKVRALLLARHEANR